LVAVSTKLFDKKYRFVHFESRAASIFQSTCIKSLEFQKNDMTYNHSKNVRKILRLQSVFSKIMLILQKWRMEQNHSKHFYSKQIQEHFHKKKF